MDRIKFYVWGPSIVMAIGTKAEVQKKLGKNIVGPFHTKAGANYFKSHPGVSTIAAAERAAKISPSLLERPLDTGTESLILEEQSVLD